MDDALIACRAIHFTATMVAFGGAAFCLYAVGGCDPDILARLDTRLRKLLIIAAIVAMLSALLLVPLIGSRMAGSASAALDWKTIWVVLAQTSFGRVWRWHLLIVVLLVTACAVRQVRPGYRVGLAALLLASLGFVGHAAAERGPAGYSHEINDSLHLLAGGLWLGGLVPLGVLVMYARSSEKLAWLGLLRHALPRFSRMGYAAVALVALTGVINTVFLVGSIDGLIGTPYGRLLLLKISLFLLLLAVAVINRLILVPLFAHETQPSRGTTALLWTVGIEQMLGFGILAVVSVLGTWPPAIHMLGHSGGHHH